jgi:hypothetical protein
MTWASSPPTGCTCATAAAWLERYQELRAEAVEQARQGEEATA